MARVLLDTTVLIDILTGGRGALRRLHAMRASGDVPDVCAVNVEEIVRGLRPGEDDGTRRLFAGLRLVPLGEGEGWRAGEWRPEHGARGQTLAQADCLIAAAAVSLCARVATADPKDVPMRDVIVDHRRVGE